MVGNGRHGPTCTRVTARGGTAPSAQTACNTFGQSLARLLGQENIPFFALDLDPEKVREAGAAGESVVYGDAAKREVLMAAGARLVRFPSVASCEGF